jgi:hypothetical protein
MHNNGRAAIELPEMQCKTIACTVARWQTVADGGTLARWQTIACTIASRWHFRLVIVAKKIPYIFYWNSKSSGKDDVPFYFFNVAGAGWYRRM